MSALGTTRDTLSLKVFLQKINNLGFHNEIRRNNRPDSLRRND